MLEPRNRDDDYIRTGKVNSNGIHRECNTKNIEYGIAYGSFWYYCIKCKKSIRSRDIDVDKESMK